MMGKIYLVSMYKLIMFDCFCVNEEAYRVSKR